MAETRKFHLGDVLTVTTGLLVSPGHVAAVHEMLDYMTGDVLMTHQLPRSMDECKPELLRQHPQLAAVLVPEEFEGKADVLAWLDEQVCTYGEHLDVAPLNPEDHTRVDPLAELAMKAPHMTVIPVVMGVDPGKISESGGGER